MKTSIASMDVVMAEYKEVTAQFRALTDIRFKLLAFLPLGTVAAVYLSKDSQLPDEPAVAVFAFIATLCIAAYNKRNDQHYDELVSRAAELERVGLGLTHGSFSQRPTSWLKYAGIPVEHRWPVGLLYASTAALWAYLAMKPVLENGNPTGANLHLGTLAPLAVIVGWLILRKIESRRAAKLRRAVLAIVEPLETITAPDEIVRQRIIQQIFDHRSLFGLNLEKISRRVKYHWPSYAMQHDLEAGSQLLGSVVDLPSRWIADISTGRR
jgi:hypothetical protein